MLSWFRSTHRPSRHSHRLRLEALEERDCPAAPVITNLHLTYNGHTSVTFTGTVQDENPGQCGVIFTGAVSGGVQTNANGSFSFTVANAQLGQVTCHATDMENLSSANVMETIQTSAPVITNFYCDNTFDNFFTISGHVTDEDPAGLTVALNLPVGTRQVTVDATGAFSLTLQMPTTPATISAMTVDWFGVQSATVYREI